MTFKAVKVKREVSPFGLDFLYTVAFTDGVTTHRYAQEGRTIEVNGESKKWLVQQDSRIRCATDAQFARVCFDHVQAFNSAANAPEIPNGDVDLSAFEPPPPVELSEEQQAQQALAVADSDLAGLKALGLPDDDPVVAKATAIRDAARVPVIAARKAAVDVKPDTTIRG